MRRYSNNDKLSIEAGAGVSKIKILGVHVEAPTAFSDLDTAAVVGANVLTIPATGTREEFLEYLNESEDVFVTDRGHAVDIEDLSGVAVQQPLGVYDHVDYQSTLEIVESGGVHTSHMYIDRHDVLGDQEVIFAPRIGADEKGISSITGSTAPVTVNGRPCIGCTTDVLIGVQKVKTIQESFIRAHHTRHNVHLQKRGRIVYQMQQDDEVLLSVVDDNRGLLVNMPAFAWFRDGDERLDLDAALAFAKVQGASLFERKSVTSVASIPVDVHSFVVVCAGSVYNVFAVRVTGQRVLVFRADDVHTGAKFARSPNKRTTTHITRTRYHRGSSRIPREAQRIPERPQSPRTPKEAERAPRRPE